MSRIAFIVVLSIAFAASFARAAEKTALPPGEKEAKERLNTSPRHGEFVTIQVSTPISANENVVVPMKTYVVYPERKEKAPVVIIIHEIYGLSDWIRGVADQLAAEGFIAIAPDLISERGGTDAAPDRDTVVKLVRELKPEGVVAMLNATREYGLKLPSANGKVATIGFCWGGGQSFAYAAAQPALNAAIVYYGTSPEDPAAFAKINAPVMGHYGGDDARVGATIEPAKKAMAAAGKKYDPHTYDGAGHGFLRQQDGKNGANMKAAEQAWPATIKFLKENCE